MSKGGARLGYARQTTSLIHGAVTACSIFAQCRRRVSLALVLSGCSAAPSQNVLGSFFPSWILCGVVGVAIAVVARRVLVSTAVDQYLLLPVVTYFAIAIAGSMLAWLFWFGR